VNGASPDRALASSRAAHGRVRGRVKRSDQLVVAAGVGVSRRVADRPLDRVHADARAEAALVGQDLGVS
jgi:hypothetical protein